MFYFPRHSNTENSVRAVYVVTIKIPIQDKASCLLSSVGDDRDAKLYYSIVSYYILCYIRCLPWACLPLNNRHKYVLWIKFAFRLAPEHNVADDKQANKFYDSVLYHQICFAEQVHYYYMALCRQDIAQSAIPQHQNIGLYNAYHWLRWLIA